MRETPQVRDCVKAAVSVVGHEDNPLVVARSLVRDHIPAAIVIKEGHGIVGVFSERSALQVLANTAYDRQFNATMATCMEPIPETISPEADIFAAAQVFIQSNASALAVMENGRLIGALTLRDVLSALDALEGLVVSELAQRDKVQKQLMDPKAKEDMTPVLANAKPDERAEAMRNRKTLEARNEVERDLPK